MHKNLSHLFKLIICFGCLNTTFAQWNVEWESGLFSGATISGWINFERSGEQWEKRIYAIENNQFKIMQEGYTTSVEYSYTFSQAETNGEYQLYSFGTDLNGDNITEFYVLGYYGDQEPYRQSIKIFDITNSSILLEKNNESSYYTYPYVLDVDNDGILECVFLEYDYPNFNNFNYLVYDTGVNTGNIKETNELNFNLKQNYPNPFNPSTNIEYDLSEAGEIKVEIFNVNGELISTIVNEYQRPGKYTVKWDGTDDSGGKAASGVYFYRVTSKEKLQTRKMILLR